MIEIYLLEQLVAFAKYKTLSATAEALHLTQPTLTRSMKKIEESFGVPLFFREHNRLYLNENGELAAKLAKSVLNEEKRMLETVQNHYRQLHTISIGSIAPGPLMEMIPFLSGTFLSMTISTEVKTEEVLLKGLEEGQYQMIVLRHPIHNETTTSICCGSEQLCTTFPKENPKALQSSVSFQEMNGTDYIMASEVGFWEEVVRTNMPDSHFFLQTDLESLSAVSVSSTICGFSTDLTLRIFGPRGNRISVPFRNKEAFTNYYCIYQKKDSDKLSAAINLFKTRYPQH